MPFCGNCGAPLLEDNRYCTNCGAERQVVPPPSSSSRRVPKPDAPAIQVADPDAAAVGAEPGSARQSIPGQETSLAHEPPAGVGRDPITMPEHGEAFAVPRVMIVAGVVGVVAMSGYCGYWFFAEPTPVSVGRQASSPEPVAETTQEVGIPEATPPTGTPTMADGHEAEGVLWQSIPEFTSDTKNAAHALGEPDGRTATVLAGGTLALAFGDGEFFYNGPGADVHVYGPKNDRTPYTIFATEQATDEWIRFDLNRQGFPTGDAAHDFGHHGLSRVSRIMIRNDGAINLYIDAIVPLHREQNEHDDHREHDESTPPAQRPIR